MKTGRKAWFQQRKRDIEQKGKAKSPWVVFWCEPDSRKQREKSCGPGKAGRLAAMKEAERIHIEIVTGSYEANVKIEWEEFIQRYKKDYAGRNRDESYGMMMQAVGHFERLAKPKRLDRITTLKMDEYVSARKQEKDLAPSTVNKELGLLKAILKQAKRWKFITEVPEFRFERVSKKDPTWLPEPEFVKIYKACDVATRPIDLPYPPSTWWRGYLTMMYLTGWRVTEARMVRREDVNLETGEAKIQGDNTKNTNDEVLRLHPMVLEHLAAMPSFHEMLFPWEKSARALKYQFDKIQKAAKVEKHYTFHDLRRGFATNNAKRVLPDELQRLMRHSSYTTTQRYIAMAERVKDATDKIQTPNIKIDVS